MIQHLSKNGIREIISHEAIVLTPYLDSAGVWTIGVGHTAGAGKPDPKTLMGKKLTLDEVMDIFERDVAKFEHRVRQAFTVPLKQHEFDAAVSFDFNTGQIHKATWVKKVNAHEREAAPRSLMNWVYAGGEKNEGLIKRRSKERDLFFKGKYSNSGTVNVYPANAAGKINWSGGKRMQIPDRRMKVVDEPNTWSAPSSEPFNLWLWLVRIFKRALQGGK